MPIDKVTSLVQEAKDRARGLFAGQIDELLAVDIGPDLKLLDITLRPQPRVNALKVIPLGADKKEEAVLTALRQFIRENNVSHKNAILKPDLSLVFAKRLKLPAMGRAELLEAIKWQLKEELPLELSKVSLDFLLIREAPAEDGGKQVEVLCVAVPAAEIRQQVSLLKEAGLNCLGVGLLPFGYGATVARYFPQEKNSACGLLHLAQERCFISVYRENKIVFYRDIPLSVAKLQEALSATLTTDKGAVSLSAEEIKRILFEQGIPLENNQVLAMLRPVLERLESEIRRSLDYYAAEFKEGGSLDKIFVAGLGAKIPNLDKFLARGLGRDIQMLSLADKVGLAQGINPQALTESAGVFGLALDYLKGLNLLPAEYRSEKIEKFQKVSLRWVAISAVAVLLSAYLFSSMAIGSYRRRLNAAVSHLAGLSEIREIKEREAFLSNFAKGVKGSEIDTAGTLRLMSNMTSPKMFFENLRLDPAAKAMEVSGIIKNTLQDADALLADFASVLEDSAYFQDASISSVKQEGDILRFQVSAKLR
jgi:type IV pilus assembly protein PilM